MPDGRFISKSIAINEALAGVSLQADYLFTRMLPFLDCVGRITGAPVALKATCVPLRDEILAEHIDGLLYELACARLIRWYECDGRRYVEFPKFGDHQRGLRVKKEAPSRHPVYNAHTCKDLREAFRLNSSPIPDQFPTNSDPVPDEVRLREVKNFPTGDSKAALPVEAAPPLAGARHDTPVSTAPMTPIAPRVLPAFPAPMVGESDATAIRLRKEKFRADALASLAANTATGGTPTGGAAAGRMDP
jgi:hypothetical protein